MTFQAWVSWKQLVARVHQTTERTIKAESGNRAGLIWKKKKRRWTMALPRRCRLKGDQRAELRHRCWLCTLKIRRTRVCQWAVSVFYIASERPPHIVWELIRQLITMSDTCGCANFPSGGGGGQALPPATRTQMHRATHTHTHLLMTVFAALRENAEILHSKSCSVYREAVNRSARLKRRWA